ncbi:low temperature requirement protein A [Microbacterium lacusdiani]
MVGRDPRETHRSATPLELLYDLTFVVAFSHAGTQASHLLELGHIAAAAVGFVLAVFAVTWAWINYTWLASAFDPPLPVALALFAVFAALEMLVPVLAERGHGTPWHPHHIAERYGLRAPPSGRGARGARRARLIRGAPARAVRMSAGADSIGV